MDLDACISTTPSAHIPQIFEAGAHATASSASAATAYGTLDDARENRGNPENGVSRSGLVGSFRSCISGASGSGEDALLMFGADDDDEDLELLDLDRVSTLSNAIECREAFCGKLTCLYKPILLGHSQLEWHG